MFISQEFRKYGFGHHSVEQQIQYVIDEYVQQVAVRTVAHVFYIVSINN